jgi:TolA-binding protein
MTRRECTSDLAVRERRGDLTRDERTALEAHLIACASCRLVLEFGRVFEVPDAPELDDGARIQRLARAAETWTKRGRPPRRSGSARAVRRRVFVLVAACLVLCCGIAAAAFGTQPWARLARVVLSPRPAPETAAPSHVAQRSPGPRTEQEAPQATGPSAEVPAAPATSADLAALPGSERIVASGPRSATGASRPAGESAAAMFHAASDARRRGDDTAAVALYKRLQRRFPGSPEAELSSVPLGEMLLAQSQPGVALEQFDRPARALGDTFRPEALYGRARALAAMGDLAGEKSAWTQLLEEFPKCPYAEAARRHLEARSSPGASSSP